MKQVSSVYYLYSSYKQLFPLQHLFSSLLRESPVTHVLIQYCGASTVQYKCLCIVLISECIHINLAIGATVRVADYGKFISTFHPNQSSIELALNRLSKKKKNSFSSEKNVEKLSKFEILSHKHCPARDAFSVRLLILLLYSRY